MSTTAGSVVAGRYRLLEQLGAGAMGTVWRGQDMALGRDVAVKEVIVPTVLTESERATVQARTMREARTAARLDDVSVVSVYDVVEDGGRPWIVMELIHGRTLAQAIAVQGYLSAPYVATVGLAILRALRAAHGAGIVHRDVKPSNVMLADDGRIVLTDFGVAIVEGDPALTSSGLLVGSPSYLPPERARGERSGAASDLWSLGATLYAAVQGSPPFQRESALATVTAAMTEPHPRPDRASGPLAEAIDGLLEKDPADRMELAAAARLLRAASGYVAGGAAAWDQEPAARTMTLGPSSDVVDGPPTTAGAPHGSGLPDAWTGEPTRDPDASATYAPAAPLVGPPAKRLSSARSRARILVPAATLAAAVVVGVLAGTLALGDAGDSGGAGDPGSNAIATSSSELDAGPVQPGADATAGTSTAAATTPALPTASTPVVPATPPAGEPSPSPSPSSSEESTFVIPAGFELHTDPTGFSVAVPTGWEVVRDGSLVDFNDPESARYLRIDQTDEPKGDPVADWVAQEQTVSQRLDNYTLIGIDGVDYRGWSAADWEFTFGSTPTHVLNRNVVTGPMAYALYWSVPDQAWGSSQAVFDVIAASFVPAA